MIIRIHLDEEHLDGSRIVPLDCARRLVDNLESFDTFCTEFFQPRFLEMGYDVHVLSEDGIITLSELMDNTHPYINKEMRRAHDTRKMLVAGAFTPKPIEDY
jgi:hypothetical protein